MRMQVSISSGQWAKSRVHLAQVASPPQGKSYKYPDRRWPMVQMINGWYLLQCECKWLISIQNFTILDMYYRFILLSFIIFRQYVNFLAVPLYSASAVSNYFESSYITFWRPQTDLATAIGLSLSLQQSGAHRPKCLRFKSFEMAFRTFGCTP